jgi:hypothetical protein
MNCEFLKKNRTALNMIFNEFFTFSTFRSFSPHATCAFILVSQPNRTDLPDV